MALITRCPVCGTLFKVVPDQLRISEGWVRCGHCAEIFDASDDLQQSDAEHQLVPPLDLLADVPMPPSAAELAPSVIEPPLVPVLPALVLEPPEAPAEELLSEPLPMVIPEPLALVPEAVPVPEPLVAAVADADVGAYSFIRAPVSPPVTPRPLLRGLWAGAAVLLLLGLGLQGIVHGRDRLAATWSETKPWLQSLCVQMGCTVQALRHIEAIVIDSSALSALQNEDAYRLNMVLKNQSMQDLAMPAIEFMLTDSDEQAVFRRVLTPAELGAASRVLFAGREWATSVDLRVTDNPHKGRIVGYRLLAFYP
jgi:predicted Zn finger-like uncharacterized protein